MLFSRTSSEILRGSWFIEPRYALTYLDAIANILNKKATDFDPKINMVAIRQRFAPNGEVVPSEEETPEGSIGMVSIMGAMTKYGDICAWGADELVAFAKDFENDNNVIGQIWLMDSGGGSVASVAPYLDFLKSAKKPVVSLADFSASANYYIASATNAIFAENNISAMFGSIGVMVEFADLKPFYEEKGIKIHSIYADQSEHKNLPFLNALNGDYKAMKEEVLNPLAIQFQNHVKAHRSGLKNEEGVLSGKMFYAEEAKSIGLIDSIGNMDAAMDYVKFLASARSLISMNY